ncbi:MAG: hypothetical protein AAB351_01900 [Patescibacteria group bacterium]
MSRFIQRIQSYLATPAQAQEKITHLLIELRHRGLTFDISLENEDGQKFFYAKSIDYPKGYISATGQTTEELESELKDAIFTAFEVPARFCISELIVFNPPVSQVATANQKVYATI